MFLARSVLLFQNSLRCLLSGCVTSSVSRIILEFYSFVEAVVAALCLTFRIVSLTIEFQVFTGAVARLIERVALSRNIYIFD